MPMSLLHLQVLQRRLTARGGRLDMTALEGVVADRPNAYVALTFNHVAVAFQPDLLAQRLRHAGIVVVRNVVRGIISDIHLLYLR